MAKLTPEQATARVRAVFGDTVEVKGSKKPQEDTPDNEIVDLITRVCYFYPQYDLEAAQKLTDSQVTALILQAEKQRATEYYNLTLIAAAPHTKKGSLVGKLTKKYKEVIDL